MKAGCTRRLKCELQWGLLPICAERLGDPALGTRPVRVGPRCQPSPLQRRTVLTDPYSPYGCAAVSDVLPLARRSHALAERAVRQGAGRPSKLTKEHADVAAGLSTTASHVRQRNER